jgi:pimeloyl-ACP methyl ester carboxylesterase
MSDKPENGYTLDQIASDVLAVADAASAMRFVLVGFSMSGKFAQYIAATCPQRVIGMALIAPVPASEFPVPPEMAKSWCDAQADREAAYKQILAPFTHIPVRQDLVEAFLDEFAQASRVALRETLNLCSASFATRLHGIELPTLVLAGDFDPLLSPDLLRNTILAQLPGATMITLLCGHEIPHEMPRQTANVLHDFLAGLDLGMGHSFTEQVERSH